MSTSRLLFGAAVATLAAWSASAAEFHGVADNWWTYSPLNLEVDGVAVRSTNLPVQGGAIYVAGVVHGTNVLHSDDPLLRDVLKQCLALAGAGGFNVGSCVNTNADGDTWFENWVCDAPTEVTRGAVFAIGCRTVVTGGTGLFANISGGGTFTQIQAAILPDGTQVGLSPTEYDLRW